MFKNFAVEKLSEILFYKLKHEAANNGYETGRFEECFYQLSKICDREAW